MSEFETCLVRNDPFVRAIEAMTDEEYIIWIVLLSEKLTKEEKAKK